MAEMAADGYSEREFRWRVTARKEGVEGSASEWCEHTVRTPEPVLTVPVIIGAACESTIPAGTDDRVYLTVSWKHENKVYERISSLVETEVTYSDGYVYRESGGSGSYPDQQNWTIWWHNPNAVKARWRVWADFHKSSVDKVPGSWTEWCNYNIATP